MNGYEWKAEPVVGGYLAKFRRVDRAEFETIGRRNGKPRIFPQRLMAENAAMSLLLSFVNLDIQGWREERRAGRKAAEAVFPKLVKQRGRTKAVEVRLCRPRARQERR